MERPDLSRSKYAARLDTAEPPSRESRSRTTLFLLSNSIKPPTGVSYGFARFLKAARYRACASPGLALRGRSVASTLTLERLKSHFLLGLSTRGEFAGN